LDAKGLLAGAQAKKDLSVIEKGDTGVIDND
jgi:hypothetical protein